MKLFVEANYALWYDLSFSFSPLKQVAMLTSYMCLGIDLYVPQS